MRTTFENEIEYICRRTAMCEKWKDGSCCDGCSPENCQRALKAVKKVNEKLIFGNNPAARMSFEDIRICHDLTSYL